MVDVSGKDATERVAVAEGRVVMRTETLDLVLNGNAMKGDVLGAARIAGIMAAKRTHELIPLCHPLPITKVAIDIEPDHALPGFVRAGDREGHRPDRRRDGGADRGLGRLPDHLRHGQGGRARHADRRHPAARKAAAASPATIAREGVQESMALMSVADALAPRARRRRAAAARERAARPTRCGRVLAEDRRGAAHAAAGRCLGDGRLCGARRRCRERAGRRSRSIGEVAAGHPFDGEVGAGEAARIFTGGVLPPAPTPS